ncbi:nucleoside transporter [Granulicella pectinivorans]|jgi:nucleoside transporter|uniref:Nucleoside transporter n=1 Tax=Granulicella pectinivorans TaxID=474950 RepID=A0A1I6M1D7_9BACT|nr:MFS transporter [Granulicella pectinivorans]SFS09438.1 nucleoside transporter [Granulicella pectinivorans]
MNFSMQARLSAMMFLEYLIWGAWYVTLSTWLSRGLHLSGQQIGWAAGTTALGAIFAPFFVGLVADKLFATQKILAALHLGGSILLYAASRQVDFAPLYGLLILYCFCFMPTLALTNSLAFRQMTDPKKEFGPIRVLGTAGWIVAGVTIGSLKLEATAIPMQIAGAASALMALYCLTLPSTPPLGAGGKLSFSSIFPKEAWLIFTEKSTAVFALASLLICIPLQFYYAFTNLFLNEKGVVNAAGKMAFGQGSELFFMILIPFFFRRLGVKYMLGVGMAAWVVRYLCFAYGAPTGAMPLFWTGILLHGVCYDFFFVTGQIYIDRKAAPALRAAAQGTITLITYGLGMFIGSWVSGRVVDAYATSGGHNWNAIWIFAASLSGAVLLLFLAVFSDKEAETA